MAFGFKTTLYSLLFINFLFNQVEASKNKYYINSKSIEVVKNDLPSQKDFLVYLNVLKRIIGYCSRAKNSLTYNLVYGFFLINANLEPFGKNTTLPMSLQRELINLLVKSTELQNYYNHKVQRKNTDYDDMQGTLAILCGNATAWSRRIAETKLNLDLLNKPHSYVEYPKWNHYQNFVEEIHQGIPNPKLSNKCVKSLAKNEENLSKYPKHCDIQQECIWAIVSGSNFGYCLNHRLIILQLARLSRSCTIFSIPKDELVRNYLCQKAYMDAKYNVVNGYKIVDLLLEQIAVCTLEGHAQFLRRSWLRHFLDYQNATGCFQLTKTSHECNDHVMGVAAGTYAAALRFILENFNE